MDDTQGREAIDQRGEEPPERRVTPNMLASFNMAYFRKASGLTQEQLGERLGGWTKTAVSAAERSWDGKRVRQFDADLITDLASIFGVPIPAFFLPPPDDGEAYRYVVYSERDPEEALPAREFFPFVMSDPTEDCEPAMRAYENRLVAAVNRYLDSATAEAVETRLKERATEAQLTAALRDADESAASLERMEDSIRGLRSDNELLRGFLVEMLKATPEGQERLEELDQEDRRRTWDDLPTRIRREQQQFVGIWRELFGGRPLTRDEADQVAAEGRKRGAEGVPWTRERLIDGKHELLAGPVPEKSADS